MGKASVPAPEPLDAFPTLFLTSRNGEVTSFDWPGGQAAWAISEITRSGPWIFALAAALAALCLTLDDGTPPLDGIRDRRFRFLFLLADGFHPLRRRPTLISSPGPSWR